VRTARRTQQRRLVAGTGNNTNLSSTGQPSPARIAARSWGRWELQAHSGLLLDTVVAYAFALDRETDRKRQKPQPPRGHFSPCLKDPGGVLLLSCAAPTVEYRGLGTRTQNPVRRAIPGWPRAAASLPPSRSVRPNQVRERDWREPGMPLELQRQLRVPTPARSCSTAR
jgi:hypothetical protein